VRTTGGDAREYLCMWLYEKNTMSLTTDCKELSVDVAICISLQITGYIIAKGIHGGGRWRITS